MSRAIDRIAAETATGASTDAAAVRSMTGFARVVGQVGERLSYTLNLKSVNHRFLDLQLRLPANCDALEMELRKILKERLRRGHVELSLQLERPSIATLQYDRGVVAAYIDAYREAAAEHGVADAPDLNAAFRLPGALSADAGWSEEERQALAADVLIRVESLVAELNTMRELEGAALAAELRAGMGRVDALAFEVVGLREGVRQAYFERMRSRMEEILRASGAEGTSPDPLRIMAEAAVLAERGDVEEEIVRLRAHAQHFLALLDSGSEVGKKLDFLLQELNREANTLLSKTGGAASGGGLRITEIGLELKSEIERAREQVQNLE